jgi:hypothetical protein
MTKTQKITLAIVLPTTFILGVSMMVLTFLETYK